MNWLFLAAKKCCQPHRDSCGKLQKFVAVVHLCGKVNSLEQKQLQRDQFWLSGLQKRSHGLLKHYFKLLFAVKCFRKLAEFDFFCRMTHLVDQIF